MLDIAFGAAKQAAQGRDTIDRLVRGRAGETFRRKGVIPQMIDAIKTGLGETEPANTESAAGNEEAGRDQPDSGEA